MSSSSALSRLANLQKHFHRTQQGSKDNIGRGHVKIAPEVSNALSHGRAVVALESTIISHGMPYPQNLETAKEVESIIKENGAVPATIAILDGVPCIGLSNEELQRLANLGKKAQKTARRDIPHIVGIPVFVTGGIGGVHRHGENTMDISSDLTELGRTPVAVISAGVKSILDIPRTLEYLETQGVPVVAYKAQEFPAFFTESSGCEVPCRLDSPEECAQLIHASIKLRLGAGVLIGVPIPKEHAASGSLIESAIQRALKEARDNKVTGNAETPFLLARVNELTGGASLAANIALVKNNALLGAKIAVALANLRQRSNSMLILVELLLLVVMAAPTLYAACYACHHCQVKMLLAPRLLGVMTCGPLVNGPTMDRVCPKKYLDWRIPMNDIWPFILLNSDCFCISFLNHLYELPNQRVKIFQSRRFLWEEFDDP
ncbi:pseudouridine-5'-phosphate glycosidase isoform X1 [Magnolia sinica]|uniref:pseudouridine-5'-phosphate glycosidase isoform X1 n=1 Tax=Magnolia sinica TaxID=86752 RepID=UPI00265A1051|nr:pseudouridine-5'-phosphate glycosidase isoform X1 [Magnolia sinica]